MSQYIQFWLAKAFADFLIFLGIVAAFIVISLLVAFPIWLRQRKCNHPRVNETQACEAICNECGKNLGFIGTWREKQKKETA